jgi:hypothetical protein
MALSSDRKSAITFFVLAIFSGVPFVLLYIPTSETSSYFASLQKETCELNNPRILWTQMANQNVMVSVNGKLDYLWKENSKDLTIPRFVDCWPTEEKLYLELPSGSMLLFICYVELCIMIISLTGSLYHMSRDLFPLKEPK